MDEVRDEIVFDDLGQPLEVQLAPIPSASEVTPRPLERIEIFATTNGLPSGLQVLRILPSSLRRLPVLVPGMGFARFVELPTRGMVRFDDRSQPVFEGCVLYELGALLIREGAQNLSERRSDVRRELGSLGSQREQPREIVPIAMSEACVEQRHPGVVALIDL